jgi:hypothetical protein
VPEIKAKDVRHRREVNRRLADFARNEYKQFIGWYSEYWEDGEGYRKGETPLNATMTVSSSFVDRDIVSISFDFDIYSGGAHPNGEFNYRIYDLSGDTVRELLMHDLFVNDPRVDTVIAEETVAQVLNEQESGYGAEWDGEELKEMLLGSGYQSCVVTPDSIELSTWPGAHIMGPITVWISYEALDPFIPQDGVLDRLLRSMAKRK